MWFPSLVQILYLLFLSSQVYALFLHFPTPPAGLVDPKKLFQLKGLTLASAAISAPAIFSTSLPAAFWHSSHATLLHLVSLVCLAASLALFSWCAETTGQGNLAVIFGRVTPGSVITGGPFALVRHPVYVAYALGWVGATVASLQQWTHDGGVFGGLRVIGMAVCLMGLCGCYREGADIEEAQFLLNKYVVEGETTELGIRRKYESYKSVVGARWIPGVV